MPKFLTLREAAAYIGRKYPGQKPVPDTIRKWIVNGLRGVCLQCVQVGARRYTRPKWLREFFEAQEERRKRKAPDPTPAAVSRRCQRAEDELRRRGILK